ncbi:50S ribosomal protein L32 [bacterium]|nr:50S ribosomal protein L32 [bacterium]MBU1025082.1 50S ribosomal protein L32 [bacterium]
MALPKYKTSKSNKRTRKAHWKLSVPDMNRCPQCQSPKLLHRACPSCGFYHGNYVPVKKKK